MRIKRNKKKFKFAKFSNQQKRLMYYWQHPKFKKCNGVIADGSIRSGKTIAMICGFMMWSQTFKNGTFMIVSKSMGALEKNVLEPLFKILNAWNWQYKYNATKHFIEIGTNTYYLYGAVNERSQDVLQGLTSYGVFADEVALYPKNFVNQMIGRCSVDGAKIWMNCNPKQPSHYFKKDFIDKAKDKNFMYLHFVMDDNLTLSDDKKEQYKKMFSGVFYQRNILGQWVNADGLIYKEFANNLKSYIDDDVINQRYEKINIGVDFGGTNSYHAFVCTGFANNFKNINVLKSERQKPQDIDLLCEQLYRFVISCINDFGQIDCIYCDSAEQVIIRSIRNYFTSKGLDVEVANSRKRQIMYRVQATNIMIARQQLKLSTDATTLKDALVGAVYDNKNTDTTEDKRLDDGTSDIDTLDAFEYTFENEIEKIIDAFDSNDTIEDNYQSFYEIFI